MVGAILLASLCAGCGHGFIRPALDLSGARTALPAPRESDWDRAPRVRFARNGNARFLWNDDGLYCRLAHRGYFVEEDEYLCVSVAARNRQGGHGRVRFYLTQRRNFALAKATDDRQHRGLLGSDLPKDLYRFWASPPPLEARMGSSVRKAKLFISWKGVMQDGAPPELLWVHVFKIKPERPFWLLRKG